MSSTQFNATVTQVPADWANDVNRLVYDVLNAPLTLLGLQTTLGITALQAGVGLNISGSAINSSAIGALAASTGRFTSVKIVGVGGNTVEDVVTHGQLGTELSSVLELIGTLGQQDYNSVAITGGSINGVVIGAVVAAAGRFTSLECLDPVTAAGVVNRQTLDSRFAALPVFGTLATQSATSASLTGGSINGVAIGGTAPSAGAFTNVSTSSIGGVAASIDLTGASLVDPGYAFLVKATSVTELDAGFLLSVGGALRVKSGANSLVFNSRLLVNTVDDNVSTIQTDGVIRAAGVKLLNAPSAPDHATSMAWVQTQLAAAANLLPVSIDAAINNLGTLSGQDADSVDLIGGSINGVAIGGTEPAMGRFTQVFAAQLSGTNGTLVLNGTGGLANSAAVLSANDAARPNISVIPNAGGSFAVMAGAQPVFKTLVAGRTIVGQGSDDGSNVLQVFGDATINGKLTFKGGTATGTATLGLGATAPVAVAANAPIWVRVRVNLGGGVIKECVMPAWETI